MCFTRQFVVSVTKGDYLTLRHGFIMAHFEQEIGYNFQKFIKRAMERDFRVVVGTSIWISTFSVLSIFFQAHKFHSFLWLPFVPLVMLLVIGAKLQDIITSMCLESSNGKSLQVVNGTLLVRPSDGFFWFGSPKFVLRLIHFIIFQNSFQLAFFTWTSKKFGLRSCFHRETENITIRVFVGILVHFLAGYVTLPLYALVTQMGTSMRKSVFPSAVVIGLRRWRRRARKNLKNKRKCNSTVAVETGDLDASSSFDSLGSDDERESELESESELEVVVVEVRSEEEERRRED
ncbi:MLO-like protein 12 [Linum grandiflorum]